jgi:ribonuclease BN (tRNA processing enzyme)
MRSGMASCNVLYDRPVPVTLEIVGCGDAFGSGGRFQSCYLLRSSGGLTLVDCGASAPIALQQRQIAPSEITAIVLTHLHGDHFGGVPFLLLDAAYNRKRTTPLVVAGPPGTEARIFDTLDLLFPGTSSRVRDQVPMKFVQVVPLAATHVGRVEVMPFPVTHPSGAPSYALRISVDGRTVAFSGDAQWDTVLLDASREADLFVCECTAFRQHVPFHLSLDDLEGHAAALSAREILLVHMGEEMLRHTASARWRCAADGMIVEL